MAIRAFLSTWRFVPDPINGGGELRNPIEDHLETQAGINVVVSYFYPDRNADGLPDKDVILVLVESPTMSGKDLEALQNVAGVTLIPAYRGNKPLSELPKPAVDAITSMMTTHKIPASTINSSATMQDVISKIAGYVSPGHAGVARYFEQRMAEFG